MAACGTGIELLLSDREPRSRQEPGCLQTCQIRNFTLYYADGGSLKVCNGPESRVRFVRELFTTQIGSASVGEEKPGHPSGRDSYQGCPGLWRPSGNSALGVTTKAAWSLCLPCLDGQPHTAVLVTDVHLPLGQFLPTFSYLSGHASSHKTQFLFFYSKRNVYKNESHRHNSRVPVTFGSKQIYFFFNFFLSSVS